MVSFAIGMFVLQALRALCVCVCCADMRVHVCKCVVCPVPIQEGCILALIGLRKAALGAIMGSTFSCESSEIELIWMQERSKPPN